MLGSMPLEHALTFAIATRYDATSNKKHTCASQIMMHMHWLRNLLSEQGGGYKSKRHERKKPAT